MSVARAMPLPPEPSEVGDRAARIQQELVDCLLCGSGEFDGVVVAPCRTTGIGGNFRVVRCRSCALAFTNPRPTPASIGQFYPEDYGPYEGRQWDEGLAARVRRELERAVLRLYYSYPPQPPGWSCRCLSVAGQLWLHRSRQRASWIPYRGEGRLLDFGCGAGGFLQEMKEFGWSVEGLDMSDWVARRLEHQTGIRIHVGTLPHPDIQPESFDAITMWNALEHVHQPREVVRAAHQALRPGGLLVVGVPNFASWSFRVFQQEWFGLELPRHLVHFTPLTLGQLLQRERFGVQSIDHIARVGWLRRSARYAAQNNSGSRWIRACRWKPFGLATADWTERKGQADFIRAVAQKN